MMKKAHLKLLIIQDGTRIVPLEYFLPVTLISEKIPVAGIRYIQNPGLVYKSYYAEGVGGGINFCYNKNEFYCYVAGA